MAASFTASLLVRLKATETWTLDAGVGNIQHLVEQSPSVGAGTADGQIDQAWSDSRSLAVGTEDLELDNLTQLDSAGATLNARSFSVVKGIVIKNTSTSGKLTIGGKGATAFAGAGYPFVDDTDKADINAGSVWFWYDPAGVAVTNGASDVLLVEATTATQTYDIAIIGEA